MKAVSAQAKIFMLQKALTRARLEVQQLRQELEKCMKARNSLTARTNVTNRQLRRICNEKTAANSRLRYEIGMLRKRIAVLRKRKLLAPRKSKIEKKLEVFLKPSVAAQRRIVLDEEA